MALSESIRGILTTRNYQLPVGLDGTRLAQWQLRDGSTYAETRALIAAAFDGYNEEALTVWDDLITVTPEDHFEYPNGGTVIEMVKRVSGETRPPLVSGFTTGHMIDLAIWWQGIGGDEYFFRDARRPTILASVSGLAQSGRNLFDKALLVRAMTTTENLLGTNGYDVPFCNGSPGTLKFAPQQWNGQVFQDTHNHYLAFDSGSKTYDDVFTSLAQTVNEHGHNGPYTAFVSEGDVPTIRALTNYIKPVNNINIIDRGGLTTGAQYFENGLILSTPPTGTRYIGAYDTGYGTVALRATYRIPSIINNTNGYVFLYKSYGSTDARNPLAVRYHPDMGFGFRIKEIPSYDTTWPVKEIEVETEYGISCGINRTVGACAEIGSGVSTYQNPTIN